MPAPRIVVRSCVLASGSAEHGGTISLVSSSTKYRQVLWLPKFTKATGTLELRTTSSKAVSIDGVVTER